MLTELEEEGGEKDEEAEEEGLEEEAKGEVEEEVEEGGGASSAERRRTAAPSEGGPQRGAKADRGMPSPQSTRSVAASRDPPRPRRPVERRCPSRSPVP